MFRVIFLLYIVGIVRFLFRVYRENENNGIREDDV